MIYALGFIVAAGYLLGAVSTFLSVTVEGQILGALYFACGTVALVGIAIVRRLEVRK